MAIHPDHTRVSNLPLKLPLHRQPDLSSLLIITFFFHFSHLCFIPDYSRKLSTFHTLSTLFPIVNEILAQRETDERIYDEISPPRGGLRLLTKPADGDCRVGTLENGREKSREPPGKATPRNPRRRVKSRPNLGVIFFFSFSEKGTRVDASIFERQKKGPTENSVAGG